VTASHEILGRPVQIYQTWGKHWHCATFLNGRQYRQSTKEDGLDQGVRRRLVSGAAGKKAAGLLKTERTLAPETDARIKRETRFYITSAILSVSQLGPIIRSRWAVENNLHWIMDMVFGDDECRVRTDHAPANFTTIKHMAANLFARQTSKHSLRTRRKIAAWDYEFLASLIA
jgi:predicted transposase YbfD/YdcC